MLQEVVVVGLGGRVTSGVLDGWASAANINVTVVVCCAAPAECHDPKWPNIFGSSSAAGLICGRSPTSVQSSQGHATPGDDTLDRWCGSSHVGEAGWSSEAHQVWPSQRPFWWVSPSFSPHAQDKCLPGGMMEETANHYYWMDALTVDLVLCVCTSHHCKFISNCKTVATKWCTPGCSSENMLGEKFATKSLKLVRGKRGVFVTVQDLGVKAARVVACHQQWCTCLISPPSEESQWSVWCTSGPSVFLTIV